MLKKNLIISKLLNKTNYWWKKNINDIFDLHLNQIIEILYLNFLKNIINLLCEKYTI